MSKALNALRVVSTLALVASVYVVDWPWWGLRIAVALVAIWALGRLYVWMEWRVWVPYFARRGVDYVPGSGPIYRHPEER